MLMKFIYWARAKYGKKENSAEALLETNKETGLEVTSVKTEYRFKSRQQNAG